MLPIQQVKAMHMQLLEEEITDQESKHLKMKEKAQGIVDKFSEEQQKNILQTIMKSEEHIKELKDQLEKIKNI